MVISISISVRGKDMNVFAVVWITEKIMLDGIGKILQEKRKHIAIVDIVELQQLILIGNG